MKRELRREREEEGKKEKSKMLCSVNYKHFCALGGMHLNDSFRMIYAAQAHTFYCVTKGSHPLPDQLPGEHTGP